MEAQIRTGLYNISSLVSGIVTGSIFYRCLNRLDLAKIKNDKKRNPRIK